MAYAVAMALPEMRPAIDPHKTIAWLPDVLTRGTAVVVVFAGLLTVTGFFHQEEIDRLRALRSRSQPQARSLRATDSTEMAGEIVATDLVTPAADYADPADKGQ